MSGLYRLLNRRNASANLLLIDQIVYVLGVVLRQSVLLLSLLLAT